MEYPVTWGMFRHENITLEDLLFLDFGYTAWMRTEFDPADPRAQHLENLRTLASGKPVVVPCDRGLAYRTGCVTAPSIISLPSSEGITYVDDSAWYLCENRNCEQVARLQVLTGCKRFRLSFEGFDRFLAINPPRYQIVEFGRLLAKAWGILDGSGRLTKVRIRKFFESGKAHFANP